MGDKYAVVCRISIKLQWCNRKFDWSILNCIHQGLLYRIIDSANFRQNAVYAYCFECNVYSRRPANPGCICYVAAAATGRTAASTNHHCAARTLHMCRGFTRRAQRWARKWRLLPHASARNSASMVIRAEGLKLSHVGLISTPNSRFLCRTIYYSLCFIIWVIEPVRVSFTCSAVVSSHQFFITKIRYFVIDKYTTMHMYHWYLLYAVGYAKNKHITNIRNDTHKQFIEQKWADRLCFEREQLESELTLR